VTLKFAPVDGLLVPIDVGVGYEEECVRLAGYGKGLELKRVSSFYVRYIAYLKYVFSACPSIITHFL
jgi:hypothetical protein